MTFAVAERRASWWLGLFVFGFAVDDGSHGFAGVFADGVSRRSSRRRSGIDDLATAILDLLQDGELGAKAGRMTTSRIASSEIRPVYCAVRFLMLRRNLFIHLRVVNDLADDEEPPVLKTLRAAYARSIRRARPRNEAKLLRQPHRTPRPRQCRVAPDFIDEYRCGNGIRPAPAPRSLPPAYEG